MKPATLERFGGPGRNGAGVLRALVEERDPATAPTQSVLEDELVRPLRRGGLPEPVRQSRVGGVLLDVQRNSDKANALVAHGWRILHFSAMDRRRRGPYALDCGERELVLACPA